MDSSGLIWFEGVVFKGTEVVGGNGGGVGGLVVTSDFTTSSNGWSVIMLTSSTSIISRLAFESSFSVLNKVRTSRSSIFRSIKDVCSEGWHEPQSLFGMMYSPGEKLLSGLNVIDSWSEYVDGWLEIVGDLLWWVLGFKGAKISNKSLNFV